MSFDYIRNYFDYEFKELDKFINDSLCSDVPLIKDISIYMSSKGGKRIRPLMTILVAKAFGYKGNDHILLASVIELIHTATLLHDDVIDVSEMRRGKFTVNKKWGNKEAILSGDFLYTRAFQMMLRINNIDIIKIISDATNMLTEGEVIQLINKGNYNLDELNYLEIIKRKTAILFQASVSLGALISHVDSDTFNRLYKFGLHLGIAYQLIDDILDYSSNFESLGKVIGNDFFEGIFTLPFIHAFKNISDDEKKFLINCFRFKKKNKIQDIKSIIINSKSIDYAFDLAKNELNIAKECILDLFDPFYKNLTMCLIDFILNRKI